MDQYIIEELIDHVDQIIELLSKDEDAFCIAIETAHQLRDELAQVSNLTEDEDE